MIREQGSSVAAATRQHHCSIAQLRTHNCYSIHMFQFALSGLVIDLTRIRRLSRLDRALGPQQPQQARSHAQGEGKSNRGGRE